MTDEPAVVRKCHLELKLVGYRGWLQIKQEMWKHYSLCYNQKDSVQYRFAIRLLAGFLMHECTSAACPQEKCSRDTACTCSRNAIGVSWTARLQQRLISTKNGVQVDGMHQ